MSTTTPFELPDEDEPVEVRAAALAKMNAIKLTVEQFEEGYYRIYRATSVGGFEEFRRLPAEERKERAMDPRRALEAFCEREGLLPADVAAEAILIRADFVNDSLSGCVDIKVENPEQYRAYIVEPIDGFMLGIEEE